MGVKKIDTKDASMILPKEKMDKRSAFAYMLGYSGSNVIWYMINNYLMLFYTDVVGLTAGAISTIMLISRVWDALNDPMMGAIVDRTRTRWGKFKPYLAIGAPFLGIFNVLTFTVWPLQGITKVIVCLLCYIGVGMTYTVVQVSINGLVNRLSNDSQVKMDIIAFSQVGSSVVSTILGACAMPLILYFSQSDVANRRGYLLATVGFSLIAVPMFWICAKGCKEVQAASSAAGVKEERVPLGKSLKTALKNRMLMVSVLMVFIGAISTLAHMSLLSYYLIYCVGAYAYIGPTFAVISLMQMIGCLILPLATRRFGKIRWMIITLMINSGAMLLLFFIPASNIPLLMGVNIIYGFTNSATSICSSMICDAIEYGDYMYGVRDDAFAFSLQSFGVKAAQTLTGTVTVLLLSAVGYVAGARQTAYTLTGINVIVNLIPAILGFLALVPMAFYKLDEKTMYKIRLELEKRRAGKELKEERE